MTSILSTLLVLGTIFLISYPLLKSIQQQEESVEPLYAADINNKEVIMNTLGEIEFDYHMKKISKQDYISLKSSYSKAAIEILKAEDSAVELALIEQEIERELEQLENHKNREQL